jgi:hypothetical protein
MISISLKSVNCFKISSKSSIRNRVFAFLCWYHLFEYWREKFWALGRPAPHSHIIINHHHFTHVHTPPKMVNEEWNKPASIASLFHIKPQDHVLARHLSNLSPPDLGRMRSPQRDSAQTRIRLATLSRMAKRTMHIPKSKRATLSQLSWLCNEDAG